MVGHAERLEVEWKENGLRPSVFYELTSSRLGRSLMKHVIIREFEWLQSLSFQWIDWQGPGLCSC